MKGTKIPPTDFRLDGDYFGIDGRLVAKIQQTGIETAAENRSPSPAKLKGLEVSLASGIHPIGSPHAHRQIWRLAFLADRGGFGGRRAKSCDRARPGSPRPDRRDDLRQRAPGRRRTESRAPNFDSKRRAPGSSRLHREQSLRFWDEVDCARLSGDFARRFQLHPRRWYRIHVTASVLSRWRALGIPPRQSGARRRHVPRWI